MSGDEASLTGMSDLVRRAVAADPGGIALVDGASRLTWADLDAQVTRAALALRAGGLDGGERVVLQLGTGLDFVVLYLGAERAGLVVVPVNPAYTVPELNHVLRDSGAGLLVTSAQAPLQAAVEASLEGSMREIVVAGGTAPDGYRTLAQLLDAAPAGEDPRADRRGDELAVLLYTSGTSGQPKGAMLSARALLANLQQVAALVPPMITSEDVAFVPLPLFHVFGLNVGLGSCLYAGATAVLFDRFDAGASLATMAEQRVTVVLGAPEMFARWLAHPDLRRGFAQVRYALSGSATLPSALLAEYAAQGVTLHEGYGLTEAAPAVTLNIFGKPGTIGRPLPGVEVELRDPNGEPVEDDADPGEVFVRGPNLFSGYWPGGQGGPDAEGWFGTGDIAVRDDDGDLRLVGHSSELVLVNGFNVYPAEVEAVLGAQPGVAEVAVVGVDDPASGEAVVAYVVPVAGARIDPVALVEAAAGSLARFKLPREVRVVERLPHTATGKVMKWRLGEQPAAAGEGTDERSPDAPG